MLLTWSSFIVSCYMCPVATLHVKSMKVLVLIRRHLDRFTHFFIWKVWIVHSSFLLFIGLQQVVVKQLLYQKLLKTILHYKKLSVMLDI